ncbi:sterol 3-beta-glucosyltransferase UGT80A2-like isoform X2 [Cicer arietinum]|uniref:Sterol 3-beta-glucosyltransferase UGT80A2-like isoform X2 n=1 Tax=Cicer arietinum TaxID=3827 RepID=A0A1S3E151_CICAR|nr:sterol 3-beta-glucosyltransferase UGT80A2-like isoform X2 [Cicer arietinum]
MENNNNNNHHRSKSSSSDNSVYLDAHAASIHSTTSSGHIDRDSSSASQNVEATDGAVGVVAEAETSNRGQCKKAAKAAKNHGLLARFFDETVPHKKRLRYLKKASMVNDDGTVEIEVPGHIKHRSLGNGTGIIDRSGESCKETLIQDIEPIPPRQIAMLIVGTRGDVQPFIAIGKRLQEDGHRVRLATHKNFEDFVLDAGLEFYPLGGDPKVLAGYMVKNKGLLPSGPSEIHIQRNQIRAIIHSLLPACNSRYPDSNKPFRAEAIIANPPAYGHTHVAEYLNVPLHIFFTMPWTPTSEFHHPLSRVRQPIGYKLSYQIVDALIWLGIHDLVNEFRKKKLKLGAMTHHLRGSYTSPPEMPYGYIWSPNLVPKPKDWGPNIDIVGFCFLDLASNYEPPKPLVDWLEEGKNPIYVGFGSLPLQEPEKMTRIIVQALQQTGQRVAELKNSKSVYLLNNCPHDWLFPRCTAVVHHGGAGTTAAGLRAECPTTIVPFFGDQPFWGERVHARGVGPAPIPVEDFTLERLVDAIRFMLNPEVKRRAVELANAMKNEDGVVGAVNAFYKHYPRQRPDTETEPKQVALVNRHFSIRGCFGCYNSSG